MNNSQRLELQPQLIEGDGDFVKGKIFIAQVVDVQSPGGGNPTAQKSKGAKASIPVSGETPDGNKVLTALQYKIFICSLHSDGLENEDLPWATPYWVNSHLGKTTIPSPRFEPGTFVYCFEDLKSRQWYIEAAVPNQLEKVTGDPAERCKAISGFAKRNAVVPESSLQSNRTGNANASATTTTSPTRVADAGETQNTVPTVSDDKQDAPRQPGEDLNIPKACKDAAKQAGFGLNNEITKLIKDIERLKANNPLQDAVNFINGPEVTGKINNAAKTITNYLASLIQEMKAFLMRQVSNAVQTVQAAVTPPSKRFIANDATDGTLEQISCLFDKILKALIGQVIKLLSSLLNKVVNTAVCLAEGLVTNFIGQLLGQIVGTINSLLQQVSGQLGQIISIGTEVLNFVQSILQLLLCEPEPACADGEAYNFLEGPNTTDLLDFPSIFEDAKGVVDSFSNFQVGFDVDSFDFNFDAENALKKSLEGCGVGPQPCGPPGLSLYGGIGVGGLFNPVLTESGELFGFDIVDPGEWTSAPKGKVTDTCGKGKGAIVGDAIIGDIVRPDYEGDADPSVASIEITKQPKDINTTKGKTVTFRITAKTRPTDGRKEYRWYVSKDLGNNFEFIRKNNKNTLEVKATSNKDNYYYICQVFDARKGLKKGRRAKSVKSDLARLNLKDVTSAGDADYEGFKPVVRISLNKNSIKKNDREKVKVRWNVQGKKIRNVRVVEIRKYKSGDKKKVIYTNKPSTKPSRSGHIFVSPPVRTEYKIIATNSFGTDTALKTLEVVPRKKDCDLNIKLSLSKPEISNNGTDNAVLFWKFQSDVGITTWSVTDQTAPNEKGRDTVQPTSDRTYTAAMENKCGESSTNITLSVGSTSNLKTQQAPSARLTLDTTFIAKDGNDTAQLKYFADGFESPLTNVVVRDLTEGKRIARPELDGKKKKLEKSIRVKPVKDTRYRLIVETAVGISTTFITLNVRKPIDNSEPSITPDNGTEEPGGGGNECPPGFVFNTSLAKCVRSKPRDPWLPPPLFPPGIISIPILDPGVGYDPTLDGSKGGSTRIWSDKCEVGINRVDRSWEVIGIGSEYTLYLGDTVFLPEREPITLGVPNGITEYDENDILWENLNESEIEKKIPGSKVFGTPYRIKDMSGFDDSRGAEIFKDVSLLDIRKIPIKGKKIEKGIYFDMTEFAEFQEKDVTFISANRTADKTYHTVEIPGVGVFNEDSGRVEIRDVQGGDIYGPIENLSQIPKYGLVDVEVLTDQKAEGWNGKGLYYEVLEEEGAIDVDYTVIDSNFGVDNAIRIPGVGNFKDTRDGRGQRIESKKIGAPKIYGPITSSGLGKLYIGGEELGGDNYTNDTLLLGYDNTESALFTNDTLPQLRILEPSIVNFQFFTDDNASQQGIAIKRIIIRDPDNNQVMARFNYEQEFTDQKSGDVIFNDPKLYTVEYVSDNQETLDNIKNINGRRLEFDDNPDNGFDLNAFFQITNSRNISVRLMTLTASKGSFVRYKKAPQVTAPTIIQEKDITAFKGTVRSRMYLETETPQGKRFAYGREGIYDEDDLPENSRRDVVRYYENTDSSRTLVISQGKDINLDMVLRINRGVFKRYNQSVRQWRFDVEYKKAKDLGFSDQDVRWHLEHVFKSDTGRFYSRENIIDEKMETRLRDPNFGALPQNFNNIKDMSSFDPFTVGASEEQELKDKGKGPGFGYIRDYPLAKSLGYSDADIRYYLTEVYLEKYPNGRIGPRMKSKLLDPTFGVFSYNPTFRINVGRPGLFDCENDYPYAQSLGFGDIDIRYFLQYVYTGLVDECMKEKLEDPDWGKIPDFRVEVTSKGCPDPCEGVVCPEGQICKDGKCIDPDDPCANVDCPDGFTCVDGECVPDAPSYPIIVTLCGVTIDNPGFGYDCSKDQITVTPDRGVKIEYSCDAQGRLTGIEVLSPGIGFTEIPTITIETTSGVNATLRPTFCFVEPDPEDPCAGITCPPGQVCRDGKCVPDPCANKECPAGTKCVDGICVPEDPCEGVECPAGQICVNGECVGDPCAGVICPEGYICIDGNCVTDPCYGVSCPPGFKCVNGRCVPIPPPKIPPDTPIVRVVDCVGKIDPGGGNPSPGGGDPSSGGGKKQYTKPKKEVCN